HVRHPRHRVAGQFAQTGVADRGQRVSLPCLRVVIGGEFPVSGPPDVELDVLGAGLGGLRERFDGPGPWAMRRNGRHPCPPFKAYSSQLPPISLRKRARNGSCTIAGGTTDD